MITSYSGIIKLTADEYPIFSAIFWQIKWYSKSKYFCLDGKKNMITYKHFIKIHRPLEFLFCQQLNLFWNIASCTTLKDYK